MFFELNAWCFGLSIIFTSIFVLLGALIFIKHRLKLGKAQQVIIALTFINLLSNNFLFSIILVIYEEQETQNDND